MAGHELPPITDPAIPAFCAVLPARLAAYHAMRRFADHHDIPYEQPEERRVEGERSVRLTGKHPDGRSYTIGYEWRESDEVDHD